MDDVHKIKNLLWLIVIIMSFSAVYFARDMFLPIVIGLIVALTLSPIVRGMARIGVPEAISAVILIFGSAIAVGTAGYLLSGPVAQLIADAPDMGNDLRFKLSGVLASIEDVQNASDQVEELTNGSDDAPKVAIAQPGLLSFAAGSIANFLGLSTVGMVLALFLLASGDLFYIKLVQAFPTFSDKRRAVRTVRDIERQISHYFLSITVINAGLGVSIAAAMYVVGLPNPLLWGTLAFVLNFLPFIGAMVGTALVAAFGILTFDTLGYGLLPAAIYFTLTSIEGQFVTPTFLGRRLELNTVSVIITVIVWSWLWSIPGALMAVPFLVLLKVISDNIPNLEVFGNFLGARSSSQPIDEAKHT